MIQSQSQTDTTITLTDGNGTSATFNITDAITFYTAQTGTLTDNQTATCNHVASSLATTLGTIQASQITIGIDFINQVFTDLVITL